MDRPTESSLPVRRKATTFLGNTRTQFKMRIICKELKGDEVVLDVAEDTKILDVKKEIESKLGVPGEWSDCTAFASKNIEFSIFNEF